MGSNEYAREKDRGFKYNESIQDGRDSFLNMAARELSEFQLQNHNTTGQELQQS